MSLLGNGPPGSTGYQPPTRDPERRAFFDLRRMVGKKFEWQGEWVDQSYPPGAVVDLGDVTYVCIDPHGCTLAPPDDSWRVLGAGQAGPPGPGLPPGGTTGQSLVKKSNTDLDTEWKTITGGGSDGFTYSQPTQPTTPKHGQTWYDTSTGRSYTWVVDANSSQWVQFAPGGGGGGGGATQVLAYVHNQGTVASIWTITHNLHFRPNVTTLDSGGSTVEGELIHNSIDQLTLTFSGAFTGTAYLS